MGLGMLIAMYGLLLGSFYNVMGIRIPVGKSVVMPPSHCDACDTRLRIKDLVPVVSWCVLRGKCRYCGVRVSYVYPLMEVSTALFFVLAWVRFGWHPELLIVLFCISVLAVLSVSDFAYHRIPDAVLLPSIAILLGLRAWFHPLGMWSYLFGAILGFGVLFVIALAQPGGMGFGDVKLFVFVGLLTGLSGTIFTLMLASFIGSTVGVTLRLLGRIGRKQPVPFGPAIGLAAILTDLYAGPMIHAYVATL